MYQRLKSGNSHRLPQISHKPSTLQSVYHLILKRKHELTQSTDQKADSNDSLPFLPRGREISQSKHSFTQDKTPRTKTEVPFTPVNKYKNVLECDEERGHYHQDSNTLQLQSNKTPQRPLLTINSSQRKRFKTQQNPRDGNLTIQEQATNRKMEQAKKKSDLEQIKSKLFELLSYIPKDIKMRKERALQRVAEHLESFNPFIGRNHRIVNVCLLKMGRISVKKPGVLYKIGQQLDFFCIILMGKVKLSNGPLKKICYPGETILEEVIYMDRMKKISLQRAKVIKQAVFLEISAEELKKIQEELIKFGYKQHYQQMEAILKRNYIVKTWLRNKIRLEANR